MKKTLLSKLFEELNDKAEPELKKTKSSEISGIKCKLSFNILKLNENILVNF